ncbi:MAG: hypothetical protein ACOCTG_05625 [Bacteroidota bacterium]
MFISRVDASIIVLVASCTQLLAWPTLERFYREVFTMRETLREGGAAWTHYPFPEDSCVFL